MNFRSPLFTFVFGSLLAAPFAIGVKERDSLPTPRSIVPLKTTEKALPSPPLRKSVEDLHYRCTMALEALDALEHQLDSSMGTPPLLEEGIMAIEQIQSRLSVLENALTAGSAHMFALMPGEKMGHESDKEWILRELTWRGLAPQSLARNAPGLMGAKDERVVLLLLKNNHGRVNLKDFIPQDVARSLRARLTKYFNEELPLKWFEFEKPLQKLRPLEALQLTDSPLPDSILSKLIEHDVGTLGELTALSPSHFWALASEFILEWGPHTNQDYAQENFFWSHWAHPLLDALEAYGLTLSDSQLEIRYEEDGPKTFRTLRLEPSTGFDLPVILKFPIPPS